MLAAAATTVIAQPSRADLDRDAQADVALTVALSSAAVDGTYGSGTHNVAVNTAAAGGQSRSLGGSALLVLQVGRASAIGDFTFAGLSGVNAVTTGVDAGVPVQAHGTSLALDSLIGYRIVDKPRWAADLVIGVRIIRVAEDFDAARESDRFSVSKSWGDGIGGARLTGSLSPRWFVDVRGTIGGEIPDSLGASTSWQVDAGAAYHVGRRMAIVGRYKRLHAWRRDDVIVTDFNHAALTAGVRFEGTFRPGS
jgi:hypothetical protein